VQLQLQFRRNHSATFKAKRALAAVKGEQTLVQLTARFDVHPNQISQWKAELLERAAEVFATAADNREAGPDLKALHAKIGQPDGCCATCCGFKDMSFAANTWPP
jgi:transposase-like protein